MDNLIFADKRYKPSALEAAAKVSEQVESRFAKWTVSLKYLVNQKDVDHVMSRQSEFCDSIIMSEKERINGNQRLLLECERARVKEKRLDAATRQVRYQKVSNRVQHTAEIVMSKRLKEADPMKLLLGSVYFGELASFAYGPNLNFVKLGGLATLSNSLSNNILELVNNPRFCEQMGKKPKNIRDPKTAIGFIGVENCRRIYPVLMAKYLIKWSDDNTKIMVPKIWQNAIITANATRIRLEEVGHKEPDIGVLLGMVRSIGQFIISNNYTTCFDDALGLVMVDYRDKDMREEYFACADVTPKLGFLPDVIENLEREITKRVVETFDWDMRTMHIKNAIIEDLEQVPMLDRSQLGAALGQGRAYSMWDMMSKSNAFVDNHIPYWLAHHSMDMSMMKRINKQNPGKFDFSKD